ncbi:MAG: prolipoprotein diacylglyceryl transferase [Planctomyces sp.]|nr:prolipoprotein diacylglyceryl transferase [Planctomyces sp.]
MRKVLLRFVFQDYWLFESVGNELLVGVGWLILIWTTVAIIASIVNWKLRHDMEQIKASAFFWLLLPVVVMAIPMAGLPLAKSGIPVFGYGFMMFIGFSTATLLAASRVKTVGMNPDIIWDMMMWVLVPGLIGARLIYLMQYGDRVVAGKEGIDRLIALFALWDGGIVFYGCIIGGVPGLIYYCRRRNVDPLVICDVLASSLFVGEGFGRIGCFLYGCCYGAQCSRPWAVQFPPDSLAFSKMVERGIIPEDAMATIPLHPTQIYSSVAAFLLAGLLAWFFPRRPFDGAVLALAWIMYPINRFVLESFRDDEPGRLGTSLTFSQLLSLGLLATGILAMAWFHHRNVLTRHAGPATDPGSSITRETH